jgi:autotransporter-associated beta strand protein
MPTRPRRPATLYCAALVTFLSAAARPAAAQPFTWAGTPTSTNWSVPTNWSPAGPPNADSATARFDATGHNIVSVNGTFTVGAITLDLPANGSGINIAHVAESDGLVLDNGTTAAVIQLIQGNPGQPHSLDVGLAVAGNNALSVSAAAGLRLSLTHAVSGATGVVTVNPGGQTGAVEFREANTYAGGTVVAGGLLLVNNTTSSGIGPGHLTVQSGATLGGSGRIALVGEHGDFDAGSRLAPGGGGDNSLRLESTTGQGYGARFAGTWVVRVTAPGTGGVAADSGGSSTGPAGEPTNHTFLDLSSGGIADAFLFENSSNWEVDGTGVPFVFGQRYSYRIGGAASAAEIDGLDAAITDPSRFLAVGFDAIDFSVSRGPDGSINLSFVPVPEPPAVLAASAAAVGLIGLARRRLRRAG